MYAQLGRNSTTMALPGTHATGQPQDRPTLKEPPPSHQRPPRAHQDRRAPTSSSSGPGTARGVPETLKSLPSAPARGRQGRLLLHLTLALALRRRAGEGHRYGRVRPGVRDGPTRLWDQTGRATTTETVFDRTDQYWLQTESLTEANLEDEPVPWPLEDAVTNMVVIKAILECAVQGHQ